MSSRIDLLLYAAGLAGLVAFVTLYDRAFPQAAVKIEITRDSALARAREVAKARIDPVEAQRPTS